jgi:hypothetical protein
LENTSELNFVPDPEPPQAANNDALSTDGTKVKNEEGNATNVSVAQKDVTTN